MVTMSGVEHYWIFLLLLPIVAFLYSSVGHGGASGYLALMVLFAFPVVLMKPTALLLNLFVAGIAFIQYYRQGHFQWKLFYPFAISSIPAAFIGGTLSVDAHIYKKILAVLLLLAVLRLFGLFSNSTSVVKSPVLWVSILIGSLIGFFSGLIGIGGGIILSPLILLMSWGDLKTTAAVSALFIWVNSVAAMSGLLISGTTIAPEALYLVGIAATGGLLGSYLGARNFNNITLRALLSIVLVIASIKLFQF